MRVCKKFCVVVLFLLCSVCCLSKEKSWALQNGIERVIHSVDPNVHVGIEVVSLKTGRRLYERNAHHLFMPASNMKLLTGAAALEILGVDYQFCTKIYSDAPIKEGAVKGNIYIKGSGDPELSTRSLEELVFQLKLQGILQIDGNVCIDRSDFDLIAQGPGWAWDDGAAMWNSPADALMLNHSCVDVWVKPNACCDLPPDVTIAPATEFVKVKNGALTGKKQEAFSVERRWRTKENVIDVTGAISIDQQIQKFKISVEAPHLYAAHVLCDLLKKNGIELKGLIEERDISESCRELASFASRPLFEMVVEMMKVSDNLIADCLFKKMGQVVFGAPGTWNNGTLAVKDFLMKKVGMDVSNMVILDGSGMSRYNLLSPHQFVEFLTWMEGQFAIFHEFMSALPISGVDGTLEKRMVDPLVKARVRAKTGSLMGASTLSGYATTSEGERLAFSIMMSGFTAESRKYKAGIEDKILQVLIDKAGNAPSFHVRNDSKDP